MPRRATLTILLMSVISTTAPALAQADASGLNNAMDRMKCLTDGSNATAAMIVRQFDLPGGQARADAKRATDGEWLDGGINHTIAHYTVKAYAEDLAVDRERQKTAFADAAVSDCMARIQASR